MVYLARELVRDAKQRRRRIRTGWITNLEGSPRGGLFEVLFYGKVVLVI